MLHNLVISAFCIVDMRLWGVIFRICQKLRVICLENEKNLRSDMVVRNFYRHFSQKGKKKIFVQYYILCR